MNFKDEAKALSPYIMTQRRYLHAHPELSFAEKETTAYVAKELEAMGLQVQRFADYNGLLAEVVGAKPGKKVLLRADIDALPITEDSGVEFTSQNPGVMHACGHDSHTAMLLAATKMLIAHKAELAGTVQLLFQSAEESGHGSKYYVDKKLVTDAEACFALHVMPQVEAGHLVVEHGPRMASCTDFIATIEGTSAHGSTPHLGKDAIVAASAAIMNVQALVSRVNNPLIPLVVTIGKMRAGKQFNIICDKVVMDGTIRTFDQTVYKEMPQRLARIIEQTAQMYQCTSKMEYITDEPVTDNCHPELVTLAQQAAINLWGDNILASADSLMGSEDFSIIMDKVPGVIAFLGIKDAKAIYPLHNEHFCFDDSNLYLGAGLYAQFAWDYLQGGGAHV